MATVPDITVHLSEIQEFRELYEAAWMAVSVTPRSDAIDRLQVAVFEVGKCFERIEGMNPVK
jgi:hypothetical protein